MRSDHFTWSIGETVLMAVMRVALQLMLLVLITVSAQAALRSSSQSLQPSAEVYFWTSSLGDVMQLPILALRDTPEDVEGHLRAAALG